MTLSKALMLVLLLLFLVAVSRLIYEREWYLVGSLVSGMIVSHEYIQSLFDDEENERE